MSHEIENAFFLRTPAWHKLGVVLNDAPTIAEAIALAYPHTILKLPLEARIDDSNSLPIPTHYANVRDDGEILGVVGEGYELVQPSASFEFFEPFLQSNLVELESGGSLRQGKRMWALAHVKNGIADITPNDTIKNYLLLYTSFDGSLSHGIQSTNIRVVCANTLRSAISNGSSVNNFKFRHTSSIHTNIENATNAISKTLDQFQSDVTAYKSLAAKSITDSELQTYVESVFDSKDNDSTQNKNKIEYVINLTKTETQKEYALLERPQESRSLNYWNAYNGVTNYLQHEYGHSDDSRTNSLWFGSTSRISNLALELAMRA